MKQLLKNIINLSFILITLGSCQITVAQTIEVELYFLNSCNNKIEQLEFDLISLYGDEIIYTSNNSKTKVDSLGFYIVSTGIIKGDYIESFNSPIEFANTDKYIDTLFIPKIRFKTEMALHSSYWNYVKCGNTCNGRVSDIYANGNIRLLGNFVEGKPTEIIEYRENGVIEIKNQYNLGDQRPYKIEYYDLNGSLEEFEIYNYQKEMVIIELFDMNGNLINKEVKK